MTDAELASAQQMARAKVLIQHIFSQLECAAFHAQTTRRSGFLQSASLVRPTGTSLP